MPSCAMNKELYSQILSFQAKSIISKFLGSKTFCYPKTNARLKINFSILIDKFELHGQQLLNQTIKVETIK